MATTEPVSDDMLQAAGHRDLTPFSMQADIMNGTDPAPQAVTLQNALLSGHRVKVFVYNQQVTDTVTQNFLKAATGAGVPVVGAYETMPAPGYDYQSWMMAELRAIEQGRHRQDLDREARRAVTGARRAAPPEILSVEGLGVSLGGRRVLDDVSFHVGAGQFTGLIGSNGAGKTTLFRVILGLTPAAAGEVLIAGRPRSRRNPLIGYVPQKFSLDPDAPLARPRSGRARRRRPPVRSRLPSREATRRGRRDARRRRRARLRRHARRASSPAASSSAC